MIGPKRFGLGVTVTVCALAFGAAYGEGLVPVGASLLGTVFGVLTYSWADRPGRHGAIGVVFGGSRSARH